MTPPMPPGLIRSEPMPRNRLAARVGDALFAWKRTEPVRLYAYSVLAALLLVIAAVGWVTGDVAATLTGLIAALLGVVPAAEAGRASVVSPATATARRHEDAARWAATIQSGRFERRAA